MQQMSDLLATPFQRRQAVPATAWVVTPDPTHDPAPGTVSVVLRHRRHRRLVGHFPLDKSGLATLARNLPRRRRRRPVVLCIPADLLLERDVSLPLAAEADAANAIRYSIETLTPFTADEVFWNWSVIQRDRLHRRLHLRLSLICKASVEPLITALQRAGAPPKLLECPLSATETRVIPLDATRSRNNRLRQQAPIALASFVTGAALAFAVLPVALQQRALAVTEARIAALQPRVAQVEALRRRLAGSAGGIDVVQREREQVGDGLRVIAVITNALPNDTYLTDLSLHQRKLALTGESAAAAKLIVVLSAQALLRNPKFVAPITRAPMGGRDTFSIEAEVLP